MRRLLPLVKVRNELAIAAAAAADAAVAVRRAIAAAQLANWHEVKKVHCVHVRAPREHRCRLGRVTDTQYWEPKWSLTQFKGAQAKEACACGTEVGGSWFIERSSLFYTKVGFLVGLSIGPKVARPSPPPRPASRRAPAGGAVGTGGGGCRSVASRVSLRELRGLLGQ